MNMMTLFHNYVMLYYTTAYEKEKLGGPDLII